MRKICILLVLAFSTTLLAAPPKGPLKSMYGDPSAKSETVLPLEKAVGEYDKWAGKSIAISGKVVNSCKKMGCWVSIVSGEQEVRTIFVGKNVESHKGVKKHKKKHMKKHKEEHGFFVPNEIVGKQVVATGILSNKEISESKARHFAKDAGASMKELSAIRGPQKAYQFMASQIKVL